MTLAMSDKSTKRVGLLSFFGGLAMIGGALFGISVSGNDGASAQPADNITICHRTASHQNPYVQITVDPNAADADTGNNQGQGDHAAEHQGPIWFPGIVGEWGDIIPPHNNFPGLNWDAEGMAIFENDCDIPDETPTATPTGTLAVDTPTPTPTGTAPADTATPTPTGTAPADTATPTPTGTAPADTATPTPTGPVGADTPTPTPTTGGAVAGETPAAGAVAAVTPVPPSTGTGSSAADRTPVFGLFIGGLVAMAAGAMLATRRRG